MSDKVYRLFFWGPRYDPRSFVGMAAQQDPQDVALVVQFLSHPKLTGPGQAGSAECWVCSAKLGSHDVGTGAFVWPEGTEHYVLEHQLWTTDHQKLANTLKQRANRPASPVPAPQGARPSAPAPAPAPSPKAPVPVDHAFSALRRAIKAVQFLEHRLQTEPPPLDERMALTSQATQGLAAALDGLWAPTAGGARLPPERVEQWTQGLGVMANLLLNELMPLVVGTKGEWQGKPFQGLLALLRTMRSGRFVGLGPAARGEMAAHLHAAFTDRLALDLADLSPFVTPSTPPTVVHVDRATFERMLRAVPPGAYYDVLVDQALAVAAGRMPPDEALPLPPEAQIRGAEDPADAVAALRSEVVQAESAAADEAWIQAPHRGVAALHKTSVQVTSVVVDATFKPFAPFTDYDAVAARELIPRLRKLPDVASIEQALVYERMNKQRKGVLAVLEEVLGAAKLGEETLADDLRTPTADGGEE